MLAGVLPAFEVFLTKWEKLATVKPWLKPYIDEGLSWAYKYYQRMDLTKAYVIAMCKSSLFHMHKQWQLKIHRC